LENLPGDAEVVYPPVDIERFAWKPPDDYFLIVSELVPYKQVDTAVRLFARTGRRLKIVGGARAAAAAKDGGAHC
jgi:glycosyltransferase involved in cell wall biosynthesis